MKYEKTAVPNPPVGAGGEQPQVQKTIDSITDVTQEIKGSQAKTREHDVDRPSSGGPVPKPEYTARIVDLRRRLDMISGTNGLLGAADGAFLLTKESRSSNAAVLEVTGRDQQEQKLHLLRDETRLTWNLDHVDTEPWKEPEDPLLRQVAGLLTLKTRPGRAGLLTSVRY